MNLTAHDVLDHFRSYVGKHDRTLYPWLNGTVKGFPNRVHGFYDCALGVSYFTGVRPVMTMCHEWRNYCVANKTWHTTWDGIQAGDIVIFDWESGKGLGKNTNTDHIGLVISVDLHHKTVTYVSADSTNPCPGFVTTNTVGDKWISGFGRPVQYAQPAQVVPAPHPIQQDVHNAPAPAPVDAPLVHPTTPSVPAAATPVVLSNPGYPGHYLQTGSSGDAVKYLQQQLHVPVTGIFDGTTDTAVKALQTKAKIQVDGVVGPITWSKLG